jgi:xylulokinase
VIVANVLAIDIGTSSTKAVVFNASGAIIAEAEAKYPTTSPAPGQHEQDALDWWRSTVTSVRRLGDLSEVGAIAFSGTMQNVILVDNEGEPLRPAILYSDGRASEQFNRIHPSLITLGMPATIGNYPNEFMAAFKIRWLFDNEPQLFERTPLVHFGAKDYIIYRLTGRHVTDPTTATTVGLMNLTTRSWDIALLRKFGISEEMLPAIVPSQSVIGPIVEAAAQELGLANGIPVINGLGDAGASTAGAGITKGGQVYIYLGTTAWVACVSELAAGTLPRRVFVLAHSEIGRIIEIAPALSGGDCVEWLLEMFGTDGENLLQRMAAVDACPPDVLFLPYLKGERSPFTDAFVRGGFVMLDRAHGPAEMLYSVMEGVAFSLRENLNLLDVTADTVRLIGGGALSAVWPQLIADVTGKIVEVADAPAAASAWGAYLQAASLLDCAETAPRFSRRILPRPERVGRNNLRHQVFRSVTAFVRTLAHL